MNRFRRALTACCCVALLAACNVRVHASVSLNADGTGRVSAVVELDKDAGRFVQILTDISTDEVLRQYPSESQLAYSRAVVAYMRALIEA